MRPLSRIAASLLGAVAFGAAAQVDTSHTETTPAQLAPAPAPTFVQEPIASASKQDDRALAIVAAMNADPSLKDSKITVQPGDDGSITLTGASVTEDQVKHAGDIAAAQAGDGKVINTIQPSRFPVASR